MARNNSTTPGHPSRTSVKSAVTGQEVADRIDLFDMPCAREIDFHHVDFVQKQTGFYLLDELVVHSAFGPVAAVPVHFLGAQTMFTLGVVYGQPSNELQLLVEVERIPCAVGQDAVGLGECRFDLVEVRCQFPRRFRVESFPVGHYQIEIAPGRQQSQQCGAKDERGRLHSSRGATPRRGPVGLPAGPARRRR